MIKPTCYKCKNELERFGAIVFSPPFTIKARDDEGNHLGENLDLTTKYHVCYDCWFEVLNFLKNK
jgi:hypothetical protein